MRDRDEHDPYDAPAIARLRADPEVVGAVRTFLGKTFEYGYYRNFTWLGRPIIQYPQDVIALQELIWEYKPTLVIETGVAHGGALILYASILELIRRARRRGSASRWSIARTIGKRSNVIRSESAFAS